MGWAARRGLALLPGLITMPTVGAATTGPPWSLTQVNVGSKLALLQVLAE